MRGLLSPRFCMQGKHNQTVSSSTGCDAEAEPAAVVVRCEVLEAVAASGTPTGLEGADDGEDADAVDEDAPGLVVEMAEARAAAILCRSLAAAEAPKQSPVPVAACLSASASCAANTLGSPTPLLLNICALDSAASAAFSFTSATGSSASLSAWRPPLEGPGHHHKQKVSPQRLQFEGPAHHH